METQSTLELTIGKTTFLSTAMADKPSRGLVLYGDGLARFVNPSHTHLHSFTSKASCGFLSLTDAPHSEPEGNGERIVREFAQLLDASDAYLNTGENQMSTISDRFMGMRAALVTNNLILKSFGTKIGLTVLQLKDIVQNNHKVTASELLNLLGFQEGKVVDTNQFDLVFVHIGGDGEKANAGKDDDVEEINTLVGEITNIAQPRSEISARLHLSLVMSYGSVVESIDGKFSVMDSRGGTNTNFSALFPRQSFTMKGETPRSDVRNYCPMLIAQYQHAVTRKDMVQTFSFESFKQLAVNLVIPADRFLHEVAFKLWKSPKYGA